MKPPRKSRPVARVSTISLALALALPVLAASLGCDDCEDGCYDAHTRCVEAEGADLLACSKEQQECLDVCTCGPGGCDLFSSRATSAPIAPSS